MSYDDIEIEDMEWNEELSAFTYPCPCGDLFQITKVHKLVQSGVWNCPVLPGVQTLSELHSAAALPSSAVQEELAEGEEIARCPSCSLYITVVYDPVRRHLTYVHNMLNPPVTGLCDWSTWLQTDVVGLRLNSRYCCCRRTFRILIHQLSSQRMRQLLLLDE